MLNVTAETKSAYMGDSDKVVTITVPNKNVTFTNVDLDSESLTLTESIESERSLTFKGCISSQLKFKVAEIVTDLRGEYIEAKIQAGETEEIPLFKGYIDEQNNQTHEDVITEFICYDVLYKVSDIECAEWYNGLNFPLSVKQFRDSFFNFISQESGITITQEDSALINDSLQMSKTVSSDTSLPSRYVMQCICQTNARYGMIGRDGKFRYVKIEDTSSDYATYPSTETYPSNTTYPAKLRKSTVLSSGMYNKVDYEPYATAKISKVVVWDEAEVVQGEYGSGNNVLKIAGNMVAYSVDLNTCARNIYNEVKDLTCTSTRISLIGLPYVECGDLFVYSTRLNLIKSIVLNRTLKGIQALFDDYSSTLDQYQGDTDSLSNQILKLNGKTNKLTRTVDETREELTSYEIKTDGTIEDHSLVITKTAETLDVTVKTVKKQGDTVSDHESRIKANSENISAEVEAREESEKGINESIASLTITADSIDSKVSGTQQVWDSGGMTIYSAFYSKDPNYRPSSMIPYRWYLNQATGKLWLYDQGHGRYETYQCTKISDYASSVISQQKDEISAKVSKSGSNGDRSFSWSLTSEAFILKNNDNEVFKADGSGITVTGSGKFSGTIWATAGSIGGWSIDNATIKSNNGRVHLDSNGNMYCDVNGQRMWGLYENGNMYLKDYLATSQISSISISANQITSGTIDANTVTVKNLKSGSLDADDISTNLFAAKRLITGSVKVGSDITGITYTLTGAVVSIAQNGHVYEVPLVRQIS